ncbi:FAD/NAD(P)-binding protein [Streptomyces sp. NPDC005805]|uniref:FAD/NAD(P)-binding protein n=1 Tax=Streptomyces sp. NPDC005805 TaxID=3157068 RepID=UPI0033D71C4B
MNRLPDHDRLRICVVGAGPRGLSVLERLCANARVLAPRRPVEIHLVDPCRPGAGRVWRTDQSRRLLMNTVASQITLFTDESVHVDGPVEPGPSLYGWARRLADGEAPGNGEAEYAGPAEYEEATVREARALGPDAYPTRALYGHYLEWVFGRVVRGAPAGITVRTHTGRAVAVDDTDGTPWQEVRLADGTRLGRLDAVVLTQGHVPARMSAPERELADLAVDHGLAYVPPANPADLDLDRLAPPGEPVLLRGLGLNFFDHMALLTEGRGGTFVRTAHGLVYRASGREPLLCAGSRRGVPYHARGENEKGAHGRRLPRLLTPDRVARLRAAGPLDFRRELWPLIAKEVEGVYYEALLARRVSAGEVEEFAVRWPGAAPGVEEDRLLTAAGVRAAERWDWERLHRPYGTRRFTGHADFTRWLLDHLRADVREARRGNVSGPLKAALDVLRDLRNEIRLAVDHGGLDGRSHRDDLDRWYTPLNAFLSIGPPALRIEQMTALIEAGVLRVAGPGTRVVAGPDGFALESAVPGVRLTGRLLVEARLPEPDVRRTADPLLRHLLATGQGRPFRIPARNPEASGNPGPAGSPEPSASYETASYETGGLEVTGRPYHVVDAAGRAHPRRFAHGVPTESVHWVTAAGIRPGVDSVTLGDSDAVARAVLLPAAAPAGSASTVVAPGRATGLAEVTA